MTSPSNAEVEADKAAINKICDDYSMEEALKTFYERVAAHQQQLLTELKSDLDNFTARHDQEFVDKARDFLEHHIERLQNKTNDGGRNE